MVNNKIFIKAIVGILLTIALSKGVLAQRGNHYPQLAKFSNWSLVAGPVLYNSAKLTPQYGDYTFDNLPILGFNAGLMYNFHPEKKWSFITGLTVAIEPVHNIKYTFKEHDIYSQYGGDYTDKMKVYSIVSFSTPLLISLNLRLGNKTYGHLLTGLKAMYFPHGTQYSSILFTSDDGTETREMFGLKLESPKNYVQGSFVVGTGCSYLFSSVLLKAHLIYVMNFQNTIQGEYLFGNLLTSDDSRGYYKLSGNYLGLLFSVSLKKKKKDNF